MDALISYGVITVVIIATLLIFGREKSEPKQFGGLAAT